MTAYRFRGMDNSGNDVRGFLDAESNEEAQARLRGQGIFVTNLSAFAPEVTPEWSAISLSSPSNIPSGQLLAQGVPCTHEQGGMKCDRSLNLLGVGNQLHLILDRPGGGRPALELPIQTINEVKRRGLLRKSLVVTTNTFVEHIFRGSVSEIESLCEWALFATEKATEGDR